ncbi:hypothetical protein Pcinc_008017 [Petrolisthes cinctipes]|uniref:PHD-type domain-containing protein n=1 Tax=Petrolisthes cinctipes TaxID=88211 RepID=A0AAE1GA35_PETCI|nr:hypothetical protein Pcinc_008017 [Petrolisthes cinctipes]
MQRVWIPWKEVNEEEKCGTCEMEDRRGKETCMVCARRVSSDEEGVQCDGCQGWYHRECEEMDRELYLQIGKHKGMCWFCTDCQVNVKKNMVETGKLREINANMKKELDLIKEGNEQMNRIMKKYEDKWKEINKEESDVNKGISEELEAIKLQNKEFQEKIEEMDRRWKEREEDLVDTVTKRILEELAEREEKERRKNNVVVFNISESRKESNQEREREDRNLCMDLFREKLRVEDAEIEQIFRLGRREEGKTRPLTVKLSKVGAKWDLIKKAKYLKEEEDHRLKRIGITPDLTRKEREENTKLREKLQERRRQGGKWIIKKRKIEPVHEGNRY